MSVTAGVSDSIIAIREKLRGKIGKTKVNRYWPGRAPEWADEADEDGGIRMAGAAALEKAFPSHEDSDAFKKDDPRLRRLAESRISNREEIRSDHRRIRLAEIVSTIEVDNRRLERTEVEEEDEEALEERRRKIREKLLQRQQEEDALMPEEEESEYDETDSEEEEIMGIIATVIKPGFVPKKERKTIVDCESLEAKARALEEMVKRRAEERKVETKQIVVEKIREEEEVHKNLKPEANIANVDTYDELNEAEYEAWKVREIARIKRDRDDGEAILREKEEVKKLRNMSEEERKEWERKNPKLALPPKKKQKFMQKYYHKGAFFQTDADDRSGTAGSDDIYRRDFSAPTGEDKMDKTILPKVMQVRHFGRSGRTKWTHLVNENTTDWNSLWTFKDPLRAKYNAKMAAMNVLKAKPKGKKLKNWENV